MKGRSCRSVIELTIPRHVSEDQTISPAEQSQCKAEACCFRDRTALFQNEVVIMTMRMNYRMFSLGTMAWALLVASAPAFAAAEAEPTHDGNVVSLFADKLVMTSMDGQEHTHALTADAKLTLDGKPCTAADLKAGTRIRVTTQGTEKNLATRIEGLDENPDFASFRHDGKIVSINGDKLVMTGTPGKDEQSCTLTADVKVTLDDKVAKVSDLKPGMRIRVTSANDDPFAAARIEALEKNLGFATL